MQYIRRHMYRHWDNFKKSPWLSNAYFGWVFMGSANSVHLVCHDGAEEGSLHMQLRRALARQPNNASWDHNPLARRSCKCEPISRKLELHFFTIISTTGQPFSGYASNWIRETDTIACMKPWLHAFTPYCADFLIHSHMCTFCVFLCKCLCVYLYVFCEVWEVKLVLLSKRGWYRSRGPWGLRGQGSADQPTNKRPRQAGRRPSEGGGVRLWCRGVGSKEGGTRTPLILVKPRHLGHTGGPLNFTLSCSITVLQGNRNTGKQVK